MWILYVHPFVQLAAVALALYALWLGSLRVRSLHLGQRTAFPRARHILAGKAALYLLAAGTLGGALVARWHWHAWFITGEHAWMGVITAALAVVGIITGLRMANSPAKRTALPLVHGLVNLLVVALAVANSLEGVEVVEEFLH